MATDPMEANWMRIVDIKISRARRSGIFERGRLKGDFYGFINL